jgi:hypothetical protein
MGKRAAVCILAAACACIACAEDRPVAFLFSQAGEGVRQETMDLAFGGFAGGLLSAGTWRVVDRKDIDLLLKAQELMLSGAFAESDAVRVGSLLSADLVVPLDASAVEGGVRLRARVLDPGSGEVKRQESITAAAGADLSREAARLAFLLAGVPFPEGAPSAGGRGSLTVTADRDGAEVSLDGRPVGKTPLVLDPLPFGRYALAIRAGGLVYEAPVTVEGSTRVHGTLILATGGLIVETQPPGARVRVGDVSYGAKRLVEKLPAERQTVTLTLPGFHWKGVVPILAGKTAKISVTLARTASLRVDADPEVTSRLSGAEILEGFPGSRTIDDLPAGAYRLVSSQPDRGTGTREIVLAAGENARVRVDLALSEEAAARVSASRLELARLREADLALALPVEYEAHPVPDLGGLAVGSTLLAFAPLVDAFLFFAPADAPSDMLAPIQSVRMAHFGLGLLAQAGLAAALLVGEEPWRTSAAILAGAAAAANVGLGAFFGTQWAQWTADRKARKAAHEENLRRMETLRADLARYGAEK